MMKGLLYKDLMGLKRTYRVYLFLFLLFIGISIFQPNNSFWAVYATFLTCTMTSTLQNSDETSGWALTCDALPVTRSVQVTERFALSLLLNLAGIALYLLAGAISAFAGFGASLSSISVTLLTMFMIGILSMSVTLTTAFLFGPQKSGIIRIAVIVVMVVICMSIINYSPGLMSTLQTLPPIALALLGICLPLLFMAGAWQLSVFGYSRRIF